MTKGGANRQEGIRACFQELTAHSLKCSFLAPLPSPHPRKIAYSSPLHQNASSAYSLLVVTFAVPDASHRSAIDPRGSPMRDSGPSPSALHTAGRILWRYGWLM